MTEETKKQEEKKVETVSETETKKKVKVEKVKKELAVARADNLKISTKNSMFICKMIMRKSPEKAIEMLELVLENKLAVPMRGDEIPHRRRALIPHNVGGSGRFPKNASIEMINLLKQLKANCDVNGLENPVITLAIANLGARPFRREGRRGKRTHVYLEAREKNKVGGKK